jgi:hypothetical protein
MGRTGESSPEPSALIVSSEWTNARMMGGKNGGTYPSRTLLRFFCFGRERGVRTVGAAEQQRLIKSSKEMKILRKRKARATPNGLMSSIHLRSAHSLHSQHTHLTPKLQDAALETCNSSRSAPRFYSHRLGPLSTFPSRTPRGATLRFCGNGVVWRRRCRTTNSNQCVAR